MIKAFSVYIRTNSNQHIEQVILDLPKSNANEEFKSVKDKSLARLPFYIRDVPGWTYEELPLCKVKISDLTVEDFILLQTTLTGGNIND